MMTEGIADACSEEITTEALAIDWTLTPQDNHLILTHCRGQPANYLCFALQLCHLRKWGRFLKDYDRVPLKIAQYLLRQLECEPVLFVSPPTRMATEYAYRDKIRQYLGFRKFDKRAQKELKHWLIITLENKFFHREVLLEKVEDFLHSQKILLPSVSELRKKIATGQGQVQKKLYQFINENIDDSIKEKINPLLDTQNKTLSLLQHYKRYPPEPTAAIMLEFLRRLQWLTDLGIPTIDLSMIAPQIIQELYRLALTYHVRDLRRLKPESKRYTLLICFLVETYKILSDHILDMNDKMLHKKQRISRNKLKKKTLLIRRKTRAYEKIMIAALEKLFSHQPAIVPLEVFITENLEVKKIRQAMAACQEMILEEEEGLLQELDARYPDLRKYTPSFFELDFKATTGSEPILYAIRTLRQLNRGELKALPADVPHAFVPKNWIPRLKTATGKINQRVWELALYFEVKKLIDRGDIYLSHSHQHTNFWETVYQQHTWNQEKEKAYTDLHLPGEFDTVFTKLTVEFEQTVLLAKSNLHKDSFAYIAHNGELKARRDDALAPSESTQKLKHLIEARLPLIRIEQLLAEVDEQLCFSSLVVAPAEYKQKAEVPPWVMHAALLAHGTNIGIYNMAHSTEHITIHQLRHASRWLVRQEILHALNTHIINAHKRLPLSAIYGDASRSSSDGQRYGIQRSSWLASYYPRYFGYYDKAISIYTHISDIYSVFSTQVISCSVREAVYVLEGILANESLLSPTIHCTDTHGFTHHIFALFYLLSLSFQPRLKDLTSQHLYKIDKFADYGEMNTLFSGVIAVNLIREQWDQLVRVIASLKNRLAPAHVIIGKLAHRTSCDKVSQALNELGKLIKTIFILRYISDTEMRYKIHLQLNRGESRHQLAQHIFFANQGIFKTNDYEEIMNKASCLSFLSNAILYWNTVKMAQIIEALKAQGYPVSESDLVRISPLMFKHIIMHGVYHFNTGV